MKFAHIQKIVLLSTVSAFLLMAVVGCNKSSAGIAPGKASSPTEAYKMLYTAVKSKDTEKIKMMMTKATIGFIEGAAAQQNKPVAEVYANGLTATTFAESMPEIRDERVNDVYGKVEVFSTKDNRWEDLAFVNEEGGWKLAVGELFADTFKSPGKSKSQLEAENSNSSGMIPYAGNVNGNFSSGKPPSTNSNANSTDVKTAEVKTETKSEKPVEKK